MKTWRTQLKRTDMRLGLLWSVKLFLGTSAEMCVSDEMQLHILGGGASASKHQAYVEC